MSNSYFFTHEVRVFLSNESESNFWELIISGTPTFNQASSSIDLLVKAFAAGTVGGLEGHSSTEKIKTEYEPVQFNFTSFIKPITVTGGLTDVNGVLWNYFSGDGSFNPVTEEIDIKPSRKIKHAPGIGIGFFNLYFYYPNNRAFKLSNCMLNSASVDIALGSLTQISWSGLGISLDEVKFTPPSTIQNSSLISGSSSFSNSNLSTISFSQPMVSKNLVAGTVITPNGTDTDALMGVSLAATASEVVIGCTDNRTASAQGSVQIFKSNLLGAAHVQDLVASDGVANDRFGRGVAIHGNTIVVGAPGEDSVKGAVYVFDCDENRTPWTERHKLVASDAAAQDQLGGKSSTVTFPHAVDIEGKVIVAGAQGATISGQSGAGKAYIWETSDNGTTYTQRKICTIADAGDTAGANDYFGASVATTITSEGKHVVAVGAYGVENAEHGGAQDGAVYIYTSTNATTWNYRQKLTKSLRPTGSENFGQAVRADGDYLAVSAPRYDDEKGAVIVFKTNDGGLTYNELATLTSSNVATQNDFLGNRLDIRVTTAGHIQILTGQPTMDNTVTDNGTAVLFTSSDEGKTWTERAFITPATNESGQYFGQSVALAPFAVYVGAVYAGNQAGNVSPYFLNEGGSSLGQSITEFNASHDQVQLGGGGFHASQYMYADTTGTMPDAAGSLITSNGVGSLYQFVDKTKERIIRTDLGGLEWNEIGYLNLDLANSDIGYHIYDKYVSNQLQIGDQILIRATNYDYGIFRLSEKAFLPLSDNSGDGSTTFMGSLNGTDYTSGYSKVIANTNGNTDAESHYPFTVPVYDDFKALRVAHNIGFVAKKQAFYSPSITKWIPTRESLEDSQVNTTLTEEAVNTTVLKVASTTGIVYGDALFWNNMPADFVSGGSNITLATVVYNGVDAGASTVTIDTAVTIREGENLLFGENGQTGQLLDSIDSTNDTHARPDFTSFVWYVPPNENPRVCAMYDNATTTYISEPCGRDNATRQDSSQGYSTSTTTKTAIASVTKHASNALRIRANKPITVLRDVAKGSYAANAHFASDMLAAYGIRNHPIKFHLWAPYCDVNVKIYRYDFDTSGSDAYFVPSASGGFKNVAANATLNIVNGNSGTDIDFQNSEYVSITETSSGTVDNDTSDGDNVWYLVVATAKNTNTSSQTHTPTPAICGLVEMTDTFGSSGSGALADFVPLVPLSKPNESTVSNRTNKCVVVPTSAQDTNQASNTANWCSVSAVGTHGQAGYKHTALNGARIAILGFADGGGGDGEVGMPIDMVGDYYAFPRTTMSNYRFIPLDAGTITVKKADGTTLFTHTITSGEIDSTHGIGKMQEIGARFGTAEDGSFTIDTAATYAATTDIAITRVSGKIIQGQKATINGTEARVVKVNSGNSNATNVIQLNVQVVVPSNTFAVTFDGGFVQDVATNNGPFFFEGTGRFYLVAQDVDDKEHTCFGTRKTGVTSSLGNRFRQDNTFVMPSNATDLRFYPYRSENGLFHYYTQTPIQLTSNSTYFFRAEYYYDEHVSGKVYTNSINLMSGDGDAGLKLELLASEGAPVGGSGSAVNIDQTGAIEIYFSRSLDGTKNTPFHISNQSAIISANITLSNNLVPVQYPLLGESSKPFSFHKSIISASGSISGFMESSTTEKDTTDFFTDIKDSENPVSSLTFGIGTGATKVNVFLPRVFLSDPSLALGEAMTYSLEFTAENSDTFIENSGNTENFTYHLSYN